jgi:hypothetical protein
MRAWWPTPGFAVGVVVLACSAVFITLLPRGGPRVFSAACAVVILLGMLRLLWAGGAIRRGRVQSWTGAPGPEGAVIGRIELGAREALEVWATSDAGLFRLPELRAALVNDQGEVEASGRVVAMLPWPLRNARSMDRCLLLSPKSGAGDYGLQAFAESGGRLRVYWVPTLVL